MYVFPIDSCNSLYDYIGHIYTMNFDACHIRVAKSWMKVSFYVEMFGFADRKKKEKGKIHKGNDIVINVLVLPSSTRDWTNTLRIIRIDN